MSVSPVICLEFNELTPRLIDQFLAQGELPNFRRLRQESIVHVTDANAEGEWLNPWVQWVTVHSGLDAAEHEVYRLSNAYKLKVPAIWDLVSRAGHRVWVCGSMNPWCVDDLNGMILPDPWSHQVNAYPPGQFDVYDAFVRKNVQEYAARKSPVTWKERRRFVRYMLNHGLQLTTALSIVAQLCKERFARVRWKRARLLDDLQFDLFSDVYRRQRPSLATFFSNTTAHYQHKFWRNMEPDAFLIRPTATEQRRFGRAILESYRHLDRIVGRVLKLAPDATVMLISGLSQRPYYESDADGGRRYYRLHGKQVLSEVLHIQGEFSYEPIMADEFFLRFVNEIDAEKCVNTLTLIRLPDGQPAFSAELDGCEVVAQCRCRQMMPASALLTSEETGKSIDFDAVFYWVDSLKSGTHHPAGVFWVRRPGQLCSEQKDPVRLTTIAPTILDCLEIPQPAFMHDESVLNAASPSGPPKISREPAMA